MRNLGRSKRIEQLARLMHGAAVEHALHPQIARILLGKSGHWIDSGALINSSQFNRQAIETESAAEKEPGMRYPENEDAAGGVVPVYRLSASAGLYDPACLLLRLAEPVVNELLQGVDCRFGILALGLDPDAGALRGSQHHDTHDALCIDALRVFTDMDLGAVTVGDGDKLAGRTRMQAEFVDDGDVSPGHVQSAMMMQLQAPSVAALATPVWC
jgi:hypothetical protein